MKNINNITQIHTKKDKKVLTGPFCFLIWIFKVEIIIIAIFSLISILYNLIPDKTKFIMKYNIEKQLCNDIKNKDYNIEEIFMKLNENNNLSSEEKNFIKDNLTDEIEENIEYVNISTVAKRLKELDTSYYKKYLYNNNIDRYELQNPDMYLRKIGGNYNSFFNKINIYEQIENDISNNYQNEIFDFSTCNKRVFFHELNHLITKNTIITFTDTIITNLKNRKINNSETDITDSSQIVNKEIFLESINEIFTLEYLQNNEEYIYNENMLYAYVLIEILPEDIIRKYKFYDNQSILISGLLQIDNNIDEVYKLFYSINKVCENNGTEIDYKNIHDGYAYFYEKRYNKKMSEDIEILIYFYGTNIQTNEERTFIRNYLNMEKFDEILKIIPKGYFSKNYKNKHSEIYLEYSQNGEIKTNNLQSQ